MVTIYVIEMVIEDDVVISHIFLTCSKAYDKVSELLRENYSARQLQIIKKQINDDTGLTEDEMVYNTGDMNILEENDKD